MLDMRRMTAAAITGLVLLVAPPFEVAGKSLPVEVSNRTLLDTGDFSLSIEVDEFGTILLTGKFLSKTATGERIVGNVLLGVSFQDKAGSVFAESTATIWERDLGFAYSAPIGRVAPAPGGVDVSELARVVLTVRELTTQEAVDRERQATVRARGWPKNIEAAVIERRVLLGMTMDQVTLAWGRPQRVNQTLRASGLSEQWVYSISTYVYFENGRVTAIQSSR